MNNPFTDYVVPETENYYNNYKQQDEIIMHSPFLDKFTSEVNEFGETYSFEEEESDLHENLEPSAWAKKAIEANDKLKISLGWSTYYAEVNELLLKATGQAGKTLGPESFAYAVAAWQKQNGFTSFDSSGIIDSVTWNIMSGLIIPPRISSPICDLVIAVTDFGISQRQNIDPLLLTPSQNKEAVAWNAAYLSKIKINPARILTDIQRYVDIQLIKFFIQNTYPALLTAAGKSSVDAVFVEAVHQFQKKIFFNGHDGKAGPGTLHSLGIMNFSSGKLNINDCATGVLRSHGFKEIINGKECNFKNWGSYTFNPSFLGIDFNSPVHYLLIKQLRIAENYLFSLPRFKGNNVVEMAEKLGFNSKSEKHKGGRTRDCGMHTFGLAVDINYSGNPFAGTDSYESKERAAFIKILQEAYLATQPAGTKIPGELNFSVSSAYLNNIAARNGLNTILVYKELKQRNDEFIAYLKLKGNEGKLHYWKESATFKASKDGKTIISRDPLKGFLNHDIDLVFALRQVAGLAWGAVDFGKNASGDIMHFDLRTLGIGKLICDNKKPCSSSRTGHPTLSSDKPFVLPSLIREDNNSNESSTEWEAHVFSESFGESFAPEYMNNDIEMYVEEEVMELNDEMEQSEEWQNEEESHTNDLEYEIENMYDPYSFINETEGFVKDWSSAVQQNRRYSSILGWSVYHDQVNDLLLEFSGLQQVSLGDEAFAQAVAVWQQHGFSPAQSDGILGPHTWSIMKPMLGSDISQHPLTTVPVVSAAPVKNILASNQWYAQKILDGINTGVIGVNKHVEHNPQTQLESIVKGQQVINVDPNTQLIKILPVIYYISEQARLNNYTNIIVGSFIRNSIKGKCTGHCVGRCIDINYTGGSFAKAGSVLMVKNILTWLINFNVHQQLQYGFGMPLQGDFFGENSYPKYKGIDPSKLINADIKKLVPQLGIVFPDNDNHLHIQVS
ncbi:hypothetical protein BH11BAC4_BH11BAC4_07670 [soil metagenome]